MYNVDPTKMQAADFMRISPRQLPLDGTFRPFNDLPVGDMPANDLIDYLDKTSGFGKTARELRSAMLAVRSADGKETLRSIVLAQQVDIQESSVERTRELEAAFEYLDTDHDGELSPEELLAVFRRIGVAHVTQEEIDIIVSVCDSSSQSASHQGSTSSPRGDKLISLGEFKIMMAALDTMARDISSTKKHLLAKAHIVGQIGTAGEQGFGVKIEPS